MELYIFVHFLNDTVLDAAEFSLNCEDSRESLSRVRSFEIWEKLTRSILHCIGGVRAMILEKDLDRSREMEQKRLQFGWVKVVGIEKKVQTRLGISPSAKPW